MPELVRNIVADKATALVAAQAITAALFARERGAGGQHVRLAMLDATIAFLWPDVMQAQTFLGPGATPPASLAGFLSVRRTADGFMTIFAIADAEFAGLCRALGRPELTLDERFRDTAGRMRHADALARHPRRGDALAQSTASLCARLAAEDVPHAPVNRLETLHEDAQVARQCAARRDGAPAGRAPAHAAAGGALRRDAGDAAPARRPRSASTGPRCCASSACRRARSTTCARSRSSAEAAGAMLDGIRILDLSEEPGFLAGKILGDLGADVIKLEPPGGDTFGRRGPYLGEIADPERSLRWLALNTSKRGITLALATPRGRELFRRLAARADVVLETAAPGALEALGLGWETLHAERPRLVWCSLTPFGRTGPYAGFRAHDLVLVAMGGNAALTGDPDRAPVRCTLPTAYYAAGPDAAAGIAMALYARERSGRGQLVDVSMQECQLATLVTAPGQYSLSPQLRGRTGARLGGTREIWRAKDGDVSFGLRGGAARVPSLVATVAWMAEEGMAPEWLRELDWTDVQPQPALGRGDRAARGRLQRLLRHQDAPRALRAGAGAAHHARPLQRRARDPRAAAAALARALHDARVPGARRADRAPGFLREGEPRADRDPAPRAAGRRAQRRGVRRARDRRGRAARAGAPGGDLTR